jgi:Xaa-Pro aminopeptidase
MKISTRKCKEPILMIGESYHNAKMYYATNFLAGDPFTYICEKGGEHLIVSQMELERAKKESIIKNVRSMDEFGYMNRLIESKDGEKAYSETLLTIIKQLGIKKLSVPSDFPVIYADLLREKGIKAEIKKGIFEKEREIKTSEEIKKIRLSQEINEKGMEKAINIIKASKKKGNKLIYEGKPLTSEYLQREIELEFIKNGCGSVDSIVACGPRSADPHFRGEGEIMPDQLIVIDIYPYHKKERYFADMTRTVVKGKPTATMKKMYDRVLEAQTIALKNIKPGVTGKAINDMVCDCFENYGYGTIRTGSKTGFIHSTGHGVGLEIHEGPGLRESGIEPLVPGNVVTVEPGLYDPEVGGVRIEDMVVVTKKGCENLTKYPKFFVV